MATPVKKVPIHLQSAQNRLLIKGGVVVNADGQAQVDIYVEDHLIKQVGNHLITPGGTRVIEAAGKLVMPGGIDCNVHFQTPLAVEGAHVPQTRTIDDFYQGTKAAIASGTTMVIDCVVPDPSEGLIEAYNKWRGWADDKVCCDYGLRMSLRRPPNEGETLQDMQELTSAEFGINTFCLDMECQERLSQSDLMAAFEACAKLGCLAQVHAVNGELVERNARHLLSKGITGPEGFCMAHSEAAEEEAVMRASTLAHQVRCPVYFTGLTSQAAADIVKSKKARGHVVFGETVAAALACDGQEYWNACWSHAAAFVRSPPIRKNQSEQLLKYLMDGTLDVVASDHATFNSSQKALGLNDFTKIPPGVNGVESRMSILWEKAVATGKITPEQFVAWTSTIPAKLFNVFPDKGKIDVGSHADIVIWDPSSCISISAKSHLLKADFNIFEGLKCRGAPDTVIVQGRVVLDNGQLRAMQGLGKFVPLSPFSPFIYDKVQEAAAVQDHQPVVRLPVTGANGDAGDIPGPAESKNHQAEKVTNLHESSFRLQEVPDVSAQENGHSERPSSAAQRSGIRVRAPPGGQSSGSFW